MNQWSVVNQWDIIMIKYELMTLWNVESWTVEPYGVYFVSRRLGTNRLENVGQAFQNLNISCTDYTEAEVLSLPMWEQLYVQLDKLDQLAQEIIQKEIPQEESVVLTLTDIMLDKSGCYDAFALGYDIGESPAGHLYVLVSFDENFTAQQDVIYETLQSCIKVVTRVLQTTKKISDTQERDDKELQIPYGDEQDRDVTIKYFNDFVQPDYEVRWFAESLGNDTLGFTVLSGAEWANLEDEFGADTVRYYFEPINLESNMFNLGTDEVFALLALRES